MKKSSAVLAFFGAIILIPVLLALPTQLLWTNCLVGAVNGINEIGFWQALGLNVLFSILFKSSSSTSNTNK